MCARSKHEKNMAYILCAILSQSTYINLPACGETVSPSFQPRTDSRKSYLKDEKKEQKRARRAEKRAQTVAEGSRCKSLLARSYERARASTAY